MKIKYWSTTCLLIATSVFGFAQEKKHLELEEVIHLAATQSSNAKLWDAQVNTSRLKYEEAKDSRLPDSKISGTYLAMNSPTVDLKISMGSGDGPNISTNQLFIGQLAINMPLYTGGKIKNGIKSAQDSWKAAEFETLAAKENLSINAVHLYIGLYQAQQTADLIAENIKKAEQQVVDLKSMEQNGIIARNDLLKAELQLSNFKVAHQEALKNANVINYQLNTLLGLDENTIIDKINLVGITPFDESLAQDSTERNEIKSLRSQKDVAQDQLNISRSAYHPTLFATGGYAALHIQNLVTVTNAANIGLGLSYDIGSLYKNKKKIRVAQQQLSSIDDNIALVNDKIKNQINEAKENVSLAKKKNGLYAEALAQSNENYRIVKDKYDNGVADTDDLLEADVQQLQSKINLAIGEATLIEKYYDLLLATGHLNIK
ncbi:TolC family protein [Sphingobacterium deserti]|uniref:Outer membrane efflux protein n=1 Tax=Sphingobacterium deserti TaxID=1229276 RepID=A0A0B8T3Y8_9SPHI|nr:TolC family protein [Sphingobacterium deserti]KGE16006.1 outer membrane efflux protein [Sphingobacterium deserti]